MTDYGSIEPEIEAVVYFVRDILKSSAEENQPDLDLDSLVRCITQIMLSGKTLRQALEFLGIEWEASKKGEISCKQGGVTAHDTR